MENIVTVLCPICGKEYRYRKEYFIKNMTCSSRKCKDKYQEGQIKDQKRGNNANNSSKGGMKNET